MKNFTDSLRELSASYFAYHRMWDDLDAPGPRGVKLHSDYYKLFVPPTFYFAPVEQALAIEWQPNDPTFDDTQNKKRSIPVKNR